MENLIIFDGSTRNVLLGGSVNNKIFLHCANFERSKMSRQLPDFFLNIKPEINFRDLSGVVIGSGPGPFTGLKIANSFLLGLLYSHGITKVRLISSFRILSALTPTKSGLNRLVVIPFNKKEYFLALLDPADNFLIKDVFLKEPFDNIKDIFKNFICTKIDLVLGSECEEDFVKTVSNLFDIDAVYCEKYSFDNKPVLALLGSEVVDITKEPFVLNHIINPAGIDNNCNIYVSNNF